MGIVAPVALRVNVDVDAGSHAKISTGRAAQNLAFQPTTASAALCHH